MNWCKKLFFEIYICYLKMIRAKDYSVRDVFIEYKADPIVDADELDDLTPIWKDEERYWTDEDVWHYTNLTTPHIFGGMERIQGYVSATPDNVTDLVLTVKYMYNNKEYKYITRDRDFEWPPPPPENQKLHFPITDAWACDDDGNKIVNITSAIAKFAGPRNDFHGTDNIRFGDIMMYDYPKIQISRLGATKTFVDSDLVKLCCE